MQPWGSRRTSITGPIAMSPKFFMSLSSAFLLLSAIMCILLVAGWIAGDGVPVTLLPAPFILIGCAALFYLAFRSGTDKG